MTFSTHVGQPCSEVAGDERPPCACNSPTSGFPRASKLAPRGGLALPWRTTVLGKRRCVSVERSSGDFVPARVRLWTPDLWQTWIQLLAEEVWAAFGRYALRQIVRLEGGFTLAVRLRFELMYRTMATGVSSTNCSRSTATEISSARLLPSHTNH